MSDSVKRKASKARKDTSASSVTTLSKKKDKGPGAQTKLSFSIVKKEEVKKEEASEQKKRKTASSLMTPSDLEKLVQFDMDMKYGPFIGMKRNERFERANVLNLSPPADVAFLLRKYHNVKEADYPVWSDSGYTYR